jgi:hypothetical protein
MTDAGVYMNGNRLKELREDYLGKIKEIESRLPEALRPFYVTKRRRISAPAGTLGKAGKPVKFIHEEYQEEVVPWRSADVKKKYLYETLGLPVQRHIKTKEPTVDKGSLHRLQS